MNKLQTGDMIRVIAPSRSMSVISDNIIDEAKNNLFNILGLKTSFSENIMSNYYNNSGSIQNRVKDIHNAFLDTNVKGILTVLGGFSANNLLDYIDYDLITKGLE